MLHQNTYETLIKEWKTNCLKYEHTLQEVLGTEKQTELLKIFQVDKWLPVTESNNTFYTITSVQLPWQFDGTKIWCTKMMVHCTDICKMCKSNSIIIQPCQRLFPREEQTMWSTLPNQALHRSHLLGSENLVRSFASSSPCTSTFL